ncbi:hypothetical protein [Candidatus Poriferisodalis sp.]|uniref:hypothetical protein n=1 Tax=Candidatus Poriferisodalis sp. TaxID=3101277 RepID=UPI003AF4E328
MSGVAVAAAAVFSVGIVLVAAAIAGRRVPGPRVAANAAARLLPEPGEAAAQQLRLAGVRPRPYAVQRAAGLVGGLAVGAAMSRLWADTAFGAVGLAALLGFVGWLLPRQGVRDTARKTRAELDQVIRQWIVLVAQQVTAGVEPAAAMLAAARAGSRPTWRLLHRHLLAAQHARRPAWEGLVDLVERYGLHNLAPAVAAFGLAAQRGTQVSDAVLVAADTLWRDTMQRERERAERRNQVIVLPATGVALALAAILVYPPFVSLTGGIIAGAP